MPFISYLPSSRHIVELHCNLEGEPHLVIDDVIIAINFPCRETKLWYSVLHSKRWEKIRLKECEKIAIEKAKEIWK